MIDIMKHISAIRGDVPSRDLPMLLLCAAVSKLDSDIEFSEGLEAKWVRCSGQPGFPHLQAAANELLRLQAPARLNAIAEIVAQSDIARGGMPWMDIEAANLIAELLGEPESMRGAFAAAALPTLCAAICAKQNGRAFDALFIDMNQDICEFVSLAAAIIGVEIATSVSDPFLRGDSDPTTAELCMPPFLARIASPETFPRRTQDRLGLSEGARVTHEPVAIADALAYAPNARVILCVSSGALFRMVGVESAARDEMVDSGRLATVFGAPSGMLYLNAQVSTGIVVLEPEPGNDSPIRFIDLGNEMFSKRSPRGRHEARRDVSWEQARHKSLNEGSAWARDVSRAEIRENNNVLTVERYLLNQAVQNLFAFLENQETHHLEAIVDIVRPRAVKKAADGDYTIREASPGDIGETGYLQPPPRVTRLAKGALRGARNQRVEPGDVLLSVKGTIGRVGIVPDEAPNTEDDFWTAGQSLVILRPQSRLKPEVLYEYLTDEVVQAHIQALAGGSAIQSINAKDLAALEIPVPEADEQDRVVQAFRQRQMLHDEIDRIREQITAERAATWPHCALSTERTE